MAAAGRQVWHGFGPGSDFTRVRLYRAGIAAANCSSSGDCVGQPNVLGTQWLRLFVAKDPSFEIGNLRYEGFDSLVHAGIQEYESPISTNDSDLSRFRDAGGKMLTFHGLVSNPSGSVWQSIS